MEEDEHYLAQLMERYLLPQNNPHELTLIMSPDADYEKKLARGEEELISKLTSNLTQDQRDHIYKTGVELSAEQSKASDASCLPTLSIQDIPREHERTHLQLDNACGVPSQVCVRGDTNGLTYLRLLANTRHVPSHLQLYIPLLMEILTQVGSARYDYKELNDALDSVSSGLDTGLHAAVRPDSTRQYEQGVMLSTYCLEGKISATLEVLGELLLTLPEVLSRGRQGEVGDVGRDTSGDPVSRVGVVLEQYSTALTQGLTTQGHHYAMTQAAAGATPLACHTEQLTGYTQMKKLGLMKSNEGLEEVTLRLAELAALLLRKENFRVCINGSEAGVAACVGEVCDLLASLPTSADGGESSEVLYTDTISYTPRPSRHILTLPATVNYCGACLPLPDTVTYTHTHFASLEVLCSLLSRKYLHNKIREVGGAYGSGARVALGYGTLFYSYRDPESTGTLSHFTGACQWAADGKFSDADIYEAQLAVFQKVDYPVTGNNRGVQTRFLNQLTDGMQQRHRDNLFAVDRERVVDVANRYLLPAALAPDDSKHECIIGRGLNESAAAEYQNQSTPPPSSNWTYL